MPKKNQKINILSFDPSMSNWGIAKMTLSDGLLEVDYVDVIHTKSDESSKESKAKQDLNRCITLIEGIDSHLKGIDCIVIELPIGSQSFSAAKSYGISIALSAYAASKGIDMFYVSPFAVKKVVGNNNSSKHSIVDWVNAKHPNKLSKQLYKSNHEADACVAVYAALDDIKEYYEIRRS